VAAHETPILGHGLPMAADLTEVLPLSLNQRGIPVLEVIISAPVKGKGIQSGCKAGLLPEAVIFYGRRVIYLEVKMGVNLQLCAHQ
jgi:hypothetical protein